MKKDKDDCPKKKKREPRCNHYACWKEYFKQNVGKFLAVRMLLAKYGAEAIEATAGKKYTKHLQRYTEEFNARIKSK